jgi:hypothetical protein
MRVAWGAICYPTGVQHFFETRYAEAVNACERGEKILAPALLDPVWGGWAHRILTLLNYEIAFNRMRSGDLQGALRNFERARASATEADRRPPVSSRPGLVATLIMADENEALWRAKRHDEARAMVTESRARLLELVEREPFLASAHFWVAMTDRNRCRQARDTWRFDEWLFAHQEAQAKYSLLMKVDPKNWLFQGNLAESWSNSSGQGKFGFDWLMRDFAAAERAARTGVELHTAEWTPPYARETHIQGRINWARGLAVSGDNPAARKQVSEANAIFQQMLDERPWLTELQKTVLRTDMEARRRQVLFEQLDWPAMKHSAEESLRALPRDSPANVGEVNLLRVKQVAQVDFMTATVESGDPAAARRILDEVRKESRPDIQNGEIQEQFNQLAESLLQIQILARSGDGNTARAELAALWSEVERVFARGPEYVFNQIQTAAALLIRAEIDGTPAEKREWLERATGYLRPAGAAGKLTRYEREVLLAGLDKQLAALSSP